MADIQIKDLPETSSFDSDNDVIHINRASDGVDFKIRKSNAMPDFGIKQDLANGTADIAGQNASDLAYFDLSATGSTVRTYLTRGKDWVSLLDFSGVDQTGVSDSTAGILNALSFSSTYGKTIWVPSGRYKYSGGAIPYDNISICGEKNATTRTIA
ncbi:MAG: glycosyl hydrolase family 28-related protein [Flavobacteriaceae bacterium]|nr:glycosyl hydrolase family 28-related protein [Flavobacteriaceae bacterium]